MTEYYKIWILDGKNTCRFASNQGAAIEIGRAYAEQGHQFSLEFCMEDHSGCSALPSDNE